MVTKYIEIILKGKRLRLHYRIESYKLPLVKIMQRTIKSVVPQQIGTNQGGSKITFLDV